MNFPIPSNEAERLAALYDLQILDTLPAPDFDTLVRLARDLFEVPISAISLIDRDRQWFKAVDGLGCRETPRELAFCAHTICSSKPFLVQDASRDGRFRANALVQGDPHLRFYAGAPLQLVEGVRLGSLCILDTKPRTMTEAELLRLRQLGDMASALLRDHARSVQIDRDARIIDEQAQRLLKERNLLASACELGKLGAWERDVATGRLQWTEGMYSLHGMDPGAETKIADHLQLYPEPERSRLTALMAEADLNLQPYSFEGRMYTANGKLKWIRLVSEVELEGGRLVRRYGLKQDITEERVLLNRVRHLANSDELTGLANRRVLRRRLAELRKSKGHHRSIALLALDLDGFKEINDTHGHAAGDACLRRVARRLRLALDPSILIARTGGDEFALIWAGADVVSLHHAIERILTAVRDPIVWRGHSLQLTCSVGAACREGAPFRSDDLLREADLALYEAKRDGKNCWRQFRPELEIATITRKSVLQVAKEGLSRGRFQLFFQPKVLLSTGAHHGFEALLRLVAEDGTVHTPNAFWAALEDAALSRELGDFVLDAALRQAQAWCRMGLPFGHVAVNLSASQLRTPQFAHKLLDRLEEFELPSRCFAVEVTEGVFLSSQSDLITANCRTLKEAGLGIAFDDFGTGYASLTHLRDFPLDTIKIDRSFVDGLSHGGNSTAIVNAIVGLGNNLGLDVVAEGVETDAQREFLAAIGCRFAQGFLFGRPVAAAEAEKKLIQPNDRVGQAA